ncbi:MAG: metallophosphoesterase family protein [Proteobacteria bacterium]|nr:metallophosphoesterase family protein [Pseudomonadota bacterium]
MRIGIFSDVHANYEALSAVLAAYEKENIDKFLCVGDIVGYGASPNECVDIVRSLTDDVVVGNHDAAVTGRMDYSYYYEAARKVLDLHATKLTKENMDWLRQLPYRREYKDVDITICHGSPVKEEEFDYIFTADQAYGVLPFYRNFQSLTCIGHSHLCRVFAITPTTVEEIVHHRFVIDPDLKYIISVGSVGQPRDYDNRATYTVLDTETREFYFKRVEYDIETSASKIFDADLERNFGNRLFIGV